MLDHPRGDGGNGWYASGLIEVRQALPALRQQADALLAPMNFGLFYDGGRRRTATRTPRCPPTRPPARCTAATTSARARPGITTARSTPIRGSHRSFGVWEGHYVYPGTNLRFIPTFAAGSFEGLTANLVVPETSWGPKSFGLADRRWAEVQRRYATDALSYPVWGISPSSTADDTGGYGGNGIEGLRFGPGQGLALCRTPPCATEDVVSPHASAIALTVMPRQHVRVGGHRRGIDRLIDAGHPVVPAERRHQDLAAGGHPLQQLGPLVEIHAVLDRVHPVLDRRRRPVEPLDVGRHANPHPVCLGDERGELLIGRPRRRGSARRRRCARPDTCSRPACATMDGHVPR